MLFHHGGFLTDIVHFALDALVRILSRGGLIAFAIVDVVEILVEHIVKGGFRNPISGLVY